MLNSLRKWFGRLFSGKPHFVIGGIEAPYMLRWFLIPRNPLLNVYLHKFLRDDDDRAMHDHPWHFISIMVKGRYVERRPNSILVRHSPSIAVRRATDRHCVTLFKDEQGQCIPCWTIVITGPKIREWGFWCLKGFVVWTDFVSKSDEGNIGKGCGE